MSISKEETRDGGLRHDVWVPHLLEDGNLSESGAGDSFVALGVKPHSLQCHNVTRVPVVRFIDNTIGPFSDLGKKTV